MDWNVGSTSSRFISRVAVPEWHACISQAAILNLQGCTVMKEIRKLLGSKVKVASVSTLHRNICLYIVSQLHKTGELLPVVRESDSCVKIHVAQKMKVVASNSVLKV